MIIYIDSVFALNFGVNYLLLRGTALLGSAALRPHRLLPAAGLGALYAVAVWLPGLQFLSGLPFRLLCAAGMLLLAFGCRRSTLRLSAVFGGMTLALCGAVYGVQRLLGNAPRLCAGGALFYPVSFFTLLLTAAAVSAACRLLLPRLCHGRDALLPLLLRRGGARVHLTALRDSGNTLRDPVSGQAVITVYWRAARALLPGSVRQEELFAPAALALRLRALSPRLIPYRAVGVEGLLLAIPCEITLNHKTTTGLVAFSPTPVSDGGAYEALTGGTTDD